MSINDQDAILYADRLLQLLGIPDSDRPPLLAKLQDYLDKDELHRINGAELKHYEEAEKIPPSNRPLRSPEEAYKILDWDKYPQLWDKQQLGQFASSLSGASPNLNTAPALVLQTLPGVGIH